MAHIYDGYSKASCFASGTSVFEHSHVWVYGLGVM